MQECLELLREGFTSEEVDFAITWLVTHYPETGAFNRVAHFIDQALKERQAKQQTHEATHRLQAREMQQRAEQRQIEEERRWVQHVKTSLPEEKLKSLHQEAIPLVEQEHGHITFGQETLVRLKLEELIRTRCADVTD